MKIPAICFPCRAVIMISIVYCLTGSAPMQACDPSHAPVVFIHGLLASGDTWATQIQRFAGNGHCQDRYFAFDWNSLSPGGADALLDAFIDSVLAITQASKVHLVGHSAGGGRGYSYLSDPTRAAKVISYAHIGSSAQSAPAGPGGIIPTINIYSNGDKVVNGTDIPGAQNVVFYGLDHYQVATSAATFEAIYTFFYGMSPATSSIEPSATITISGRCVTLGENTATTNVTIEMFKTDANGDPIPPAITSFTVGASGHWGPVEVEPETNYMFFVTSASSSFRKVIYYYEPFIRDNPAVYIRTFPPALSLAGLLLSAVPNNDNQSVISIFTSTQAVIHGRDSLSLDGIDLATAALASESASMIALFCYDNGADGQGNGEPMANFAAFPFLQGADIPVPPAPEKTWNITFNGTTMPVRNWRSKSDGVVIAVFNEPQKTVTSIPHNQTKGYLPPILIPNPATHTLWVESERIGDQPIQWRMSNMLGQIFEANEVFTEKGKMQLDLSQIPSGSYIFTLSTGSEKTSSVIQIVR